MLKHCALSLVLLFCIHGSSRLALSETEPPILSRRDAVLIAEAYHLHQSLADKMWPGWSEIRTPLVYVTSEYEYAIDFPNQLSGFQSVAKDSLLRRPVQARKRTLSAELSASFDIEGVSAVVMGTPQALEKSLGAWVLTAAHEMFHVLQRARGGFQKVARLGIGSETDASWQLNFAFPYKDADVMNLIHVQSYLVFLAATSTTPDDVKYNAGSAIEAIRVYKNLLQRVTSEEKSYKYSQFQEWSEGVAFYTEYKIAELAANSTYQPLPEFQRLDGFTSYEQVWTEQYKNRPFLAKHAGRAARTRTAFYHLGLGKALLLDRIMPEWKTRYFAPQVWVNDLLMTALGQPVELMQLRVGSITPTFTLTDINGAKVSLNQYRGQAVLLDFWEVWCPPCVDEIPHLNALQDKYRGQGLIVLGITSHNTKSIPLLKEFLKKNDLRYTTLVDDGGNIGKLYNVSGYPHVFLLNREGNLVYDKIGYNRGEEVELEQEIKKAISKGSSAPRSNSN